jgi:hypothetical protein
VVQVDRCSDRLEQTLDHAHGLGRLGDRGDDHGELAAAEARSRVTGAQRRMDARTDRREHLVSALMAPAVVDVLRRTHQRQLLDERPVAPRDVVVRLGIGHG